METFNAVIKGALVAAAAAVSSFWLWTLARAWAGGVRDADPGAIFAGSIEALLATCIGAVSMPILLWAGMRALGERGRLPFVLVGTVAWLIVGAHVVEDEVGVAGTVAWLAVFVLLGAVLALPKPPASDATG